ncbi:MAG: hypothetical protein GY702_28065 [Desulfobulbaceae bacterium]|nr:hypothetical protein [Desulfobulbaceae bacterium]
MHPYLQRAQTLLPVNVAPFLCQGDLQRIHTGLGKIWLERGKEAKLNKLDRYADMIQAHEHYIRAIATNPHDILAVQGIAETVAELEFTFPELFPGKVNPYNALSLFTRMREVEPNGFDSNYSHADYLYKRELHKELLLQVQHTAKIFPSYGKIKRASFYSPAMREAIKSGLREAIDNKIMTRSAFFSLSTMYKEEKEYAQAAVYYERGMLERENTITDKNYVNLGSLHLRAGSMDETYQAFTACLRMSPNSHKMIQIIFSRFKKDQNLDGFVTFAKVASTNRNLERPLRLYVAKAHIGLEDFETAKENLHTINRDKPSPEAYYLLAEVARKERDWDAMELSIQRATVLDPKNGRYYKILADALIYQKKYRPAAKYMQKALANDPENTTYRKKLTKIRSYYK